MTPTLQDENLRRMLLAQSISVAPRPRPPWYETAALTGTAVFSIAFFAGLVWHLIIGL